jgi:hypothetical protein
MTSPWPSACSAIGSLLGILPGGGLLFLARISLVLVGMPLISKRRAAVFVADD